MEDFLTIKKNFMNDNSKGLYILCDGHSGDQVAKIVIEKLPDIIEKTFLENNFEIEKSLVDSFKKMDEELKEHEETGSTCIAIYICIENGERIVYSANIGDSRSIL